MKPITPATRVSRRCDLLASKVGGETVMLDVEQGCYFGLDDIGSDVWARLETPIQVAELCAKLAVVYAVDEKTCLTDAIALLEQLRDARLIEIHPEP